MEGGHPELAKDLAGSGVSLESLKTTDTSLDKNAVLRLLGHFLRRGRAALQGRVFDSIHEWPLGPVAPQGLKCVRENYSSAPAGLDRSPLLTHGLRRGL